MKFSATFVALALIAVNVSAHELPSRFAAARRGDQFVTGPCAKDSDCQQGCCAFTTGKCAGPAVAQTRDGGCGFGSAAPNCNVAKAIGLSDCVAGAVNGNLADPDVQKAAAFSANLNGIPFTPAAAAPPPAAGAPPPPAAGAGGKSVAELAALQTSKKTVFVECGSDSECQQGCCGFSSGKCAGPNVAQTNGSGGCGRGNAAPNCDVSTLLGFKNCIGGAKQGDLNAAAVQQATAFSAQLNGIAFTPSAGGAAPPPAAGAPPPPPAASAPKSVAELAALQTSKKTVFVECASDSECQQGCCGFSSGKCAGPNVAQTNGSGGCGRGNAAPNCDVSTLLGFQNCIGGAQKGDLKAAAVQQATAFSAQLNGIAFTPSR
ncbi:hypothetical protein R3P38DRAFT_3365889 [Favolaschia claudopus]|uniref:Biotrophy-associated secreted protein 2 n=1 Tax=Favolaschia claudopus TaxID=2862362 RepID=A0AAW0AF93_9AGAR